VLSAVKITPVTVERGGFFLTCVREWVNAAETEVKEPGF
jgi:hypothetical protein